MKRLPWQAQAALVLLSVVAITIAARRWVPAPGGGTSATIRPYFMPAVNVRANCEKIVRMRQIIPWSMRVVQPRNDPVRVSATRWTYDLQIWSQNSLGAMRRSAWHCIVRGRAIIVERRTAP